jgi:type I restriction enzyme M protein
VGLKNTKTAQVGAAGQAAVAKAARAAPAPKSKNKGAARLEQDIQMKKPGTKPTKSAAKLAVEATMPDPTALELVDGDSVPSSEEIQELISHIVIGGSAGDAPMTWRDLAADDIGEGTIACVEVDLAAASVRYSRGIWTGRSITVLKDEEIARAWLVNRLVNQLGYDAKRIKLENEYVAGRGRRGTSENSVRIDAIVEDENQVPFYFIEVKAPDKYEGDKILIDRQLFAVAALHQSTTGDRPKFLAYYTIEEVGGSLRDKVIVVDYEKFKTYDLWDKAGRPTVSDALSEKYARPKKIAYVRKGPRDLISEFAPSQVKDLATSLHNVLWGGGSTGDTEVFTSLVNIILAKIQDEYDTKDLEPYSFQIFQHGDVAESPETIYERLNGVYRTALADQLGKSGDLSSQHIVNREKFPLAKLVFAVGQIEKYSFVDGKNSLNGKDLLGDFFEQIQRDGFKQSKGQFFTPVNIVKFILYALELDTLSIDMLNTERKLPLIIDPSCGSATFLIEAMKMVTSEIKQRQKSKLKTTRQVQGAFESMFLPDHQEHRWAREFLYGIEHNFDLATAAKVNMILHGDGSTNIFHKDGLMPFSAYEHPPALGSPNVLKIRVANDAYAGKDVNGQFHVVISNPPFSVDLDDVTKKTLGKSFLFGGKKNSENLFIERYWQLLRDKGRMAIVLPESVFDTTENKYIRLFLFQFFHVRSVVSLPQLAFVPYTSTKTSILFAQKKTAVEVARWKSLWEVQSSRYGKLSTRIQNHFKVHIEGVAPSSLPSVKKSTDADARRDISDFLGKPLSDEEATMPLAQLLELKRHFLGLELEVDTDVADVFGRVNCNWVMRQVLIQSVKDAEKMQDASLDQNSEIFLAEARNIGYKRSKRGEIVQPNELFSLEGAPSKVDANIVAINYAKVIEDVEQRIVAARKRLAQAAGDQEAAKRYEEQVRKLSDKEEELIAERTRVTAALAGFYDANGAMKAQYEDRSDPELRAIFDFSLMAHLRSSAVLLAPTSRATILDRMRAKGLWK